MHEFRICLAVLLVVSSACVPGCSGNAQRGNAQEDLAFISSAYTTYCQARPRQAPSKAEDLQADLESHSPVAYQALKDGKYVFIYDVPVMSLHDSASETSPAILAYEKDVPTKGGYVLMGGGTVRQITAAEFQSAPKAKGPKK